MANAPKKGTAFKFDLTKPDKRGTLMKQGALHKAFKYRYFVLYPGFLVYYESENKWKVDLTKGDTLGHRIGAIKLKNGSVKVARDAPKGCKFGIIVQAPDPANKRQTYLLNATNKVDRDAWIYAIETCIPSTGSPKHKKKDAPKEAVNEPLSPQRAPVVHQDTATDAAFLASENADTTEDTPDTHLEPSPTMAARHDTADIAALLGSEQEDVRREEEEEEPITSLDRETISEVIGEKVNGKDEGSSDEASVTPSPEPLMIANGPQSISSADTIGAVLLSNGEGTSNKGGKAGEGQSHAEEGKAEEEKRRAEQEEEEEEREVEKKVEERENEEAQTEKIEDRQPTLQPPTEADSEDDSADSQPMPTERKVESSMDIEGKIEVVTSVSVTLTNGVSDGNNKEADRSLLNGEGGTEQRSQNGVGTEGVARRSENGVETKSEPERKTSGGSEVEVEVAVNGRSRGGLTITMVEDDLTSSSSEDGDQPNSPTLPPFPPTTLQTTPTNSTSSDTSTPTMPSSPGTPSIQIIKVPTMQRIPEDMMTKDEEAMAQRLAANKGMRRSSAPFIEKRGFLYKEGGNRKTWKRRYFVLQPGSFTYYKTTPNSKPIAEVKLKCFQLRYPGPGERKQSFQFTVHTESSWNKRSDYVLAAQTDFEMKEWTAAFKLAGQKNGPSPNTSPGGSDEEVEQNGMTPASQHQPLPAS